MPTNFGQINEFDPTLESWKSYTERLQHYFTANDTPAAKKKSILITVMGPSTFALAKSLCQPDDISTKSYDQLVKILEDHYCPAPSEIVQRYKFHSRTRKSTESVATYIAELRALGEHCKFHDLNMMIRDKLVCGINDFNIQRRLLQEPSLTFQKAYELATAMESAAKNVLDIRSSSSVTSTSSGQSPQLHKVEASKHPERECHRCGGKNHIAPSCNFKDAICRACGKKGHLARVCRSKQKPDQAFSIRKTSNPAKVHSVDQPSTSEVGIEPEPEKHHVYNLSHKSPPFQMTLEINNHNLQMELDTGASLSLISSNTYSSLFSGYSLDPSDIKLQTYSGEVIPVMGLFQVQVKHNQQDVTLPLLVVEGDGPSLLGRNWLRTLRLDWHGIYHVHMTNSIEHVTQKYQDVFNQELGCVHDVKAKINISNGAKPKFFKARSVSYYNKQKVEAELERLQTQGIITPVTYSEWATPVVPVAKPDNKIRLCGDYKITINPVIQLDAYPLPKIQELFASLSGGTVFSKLDLAHAYQQVPLDEESKKLTTINTHKGLFQYSHLELLQPLLFSKEFWKMY